MVFFFSPFYSFSFAYTVGEVNSGRVCLHFHCFVRMCEMLVVIDVVVSVDAVAVDIDVSTSMTRERNGREKRNNEEEG